MGQCCSCLHPGGDLPSLPEPERITLHEARPSWRRSPPAGHEEASSSEASDATRNSRLQEPNQHNREPRPDPELSEILHRIVSSDDNHAQPTVGRGETNCLVIRPGGWRCLPLPLAFSSVGLWIGITVRGIGYAAG